MHTRFAALAAAALLASCSTYTAPDSVVFGTVVGTQTKPATDWSGYTTFSVNPLVTVVDSTGNIDQNYTISAQPFVDDLRQHMLDAGYTELAWPILGTPSTAHLQLVVDARIGSQDVYYPGWCYWYGYYGYSCYPSWTYAGSYNYGTVEVTMGDFLNYDGVTNRLPLVWTAALYGVLTSYCQPQTPSCNPNWTRINAALDRAFQDSPYIHK